jgi:WD40 repeat protein
MTPTPLQHDEEALLDEVIAAFLEAEEAGHPPDAEELLGAYPHLGEKLKRFLAGHVRLARLTAPLRTVAAAARSEGSGTAATPGALDVTPGKQAAAVADQAGQTFGPYVLLERIGRGGMGVVYRARHVGLNRLVALKVLPPVGPGMEANRFRNEAEMIAALDHPGIVPVYEVGEHAGSAYFAMKLCEGGSLAERLTNYRDDARSAACLVVQVAHALYHAHQHGILHRDLKPSNILLDASGTPHLADFGLAKRLQSGPDLTLSGTLLGTPSYMAPEQTAGTRAAVTTVTDIYGLGAVLYALLTGAPPFRGPTPLEILLLVQHTQPRPPRALNPRLDRDLETICLKCLEKDASRRYASAAALAEDLERWLRGEPIAARPVGRLERVRAWCRRNRLVAGLSALVATLLLAGVIGLGTSTVLITASRDEAIRERKEADRQREQALGWAAVARERLYAYEVRHAARAWELGNTPQALELLRRHVPGSGEVDRRGFEWYYLHHLCGDGNTPLRTLHGHEGEVYRIAYAPDGKTLATTGRDGTALLWDPATGAPRLGLRGHWISGAAFSPDGKVLVTTSLFGAVRTWKVATGRLLRTLFQAGAIVQHLAASPDGRTLALTVGSANATLLLLDFPSGKLRRRWQPHGSANVDGIAFSPDGKLLASAGRDGVAHFWDAATGACRLTLRGHTGGVCSVAFAHRTGLVATASRDQTVRLWDAASGAFLPVLGQHMQDVRWVAFAPDDSALAACDASGCVRLWEVPTLRLLHAFPLHGLDAFAVAFAPDGKTLASASKDGTVQIWDAAARQARRLRFTAPHAVSALALHPDGQRLAVGDGRVRLLDLSGGPTRELLAGLSKPTRLAFAPGGQALAAGLFNGEVRLYDLRLDKPGPTIRAHGGPVQALAFTPDGKLLTANLSDRARLWDAGTGRPLRSFELEAGTPCTLFALSHDGRWLATRYEPGGVVVWDMASGRVSKRLPRQPSHAASMAFSPDGKHLAVARDDRAVELWEWQTDADPRRMLGHTRLSAQLAFTPDGRTLASCGDGTIYLWHVPSGQELLRLHGQAGVVLSLNFSQDNRRLLVGDSGSNGRGEILVWDAQRLPQDPR